VITAAVAPLTAETAAPAQVHEVLVADNLTRTQIVQYAGASGDYNPLHTDEPYAVQVAGYDSVIAHGMLTMGLTARALTDWLGAGRLVRYGVRFKAPVVPGDTLTARLVVEVVEPGPAGVLVTVAVETVNAVGTAVLSGTATGQLPRTES
jgi:acyl dehydratase